MCNVQAHKINGQSKLKTDLCQSLYFSSHPTFKPPIWVKILT
uniref:E3 ubiquitin-protein ligase Topors n=1 Tax=Rhizophora mucronata TaxID=61149 RepID=A0A2P2KVM7_RHIMU